MLSEVVQCSAFFRLAIISHQILIYLYVTVPLSLFLMLIHAKECVPTQK